MQNNFSIVIPVLNESENIEKLTKRITYFFTKFSYEIIFVDDNSTDNSKYIFKKLKKKYKNFKFYIRKNKKRDLSKSCIYGFKKSKNPNIIVMDGDLQHDPKYLNKMSDCYIKNKLDFLVGARDFSKFKISGLSLFRYWSSKIFIFFFKLLIGNITNDPMAGYFIFKKKIYLQKRNKLFSAGYKILSDLLYSGDNSLKSKDLIIKFNYRVSGKSKMNFKVLLNIIFFILKKKFKT
jgi:dolichol-phosphate mannosyltransferase